jgi:ABC-2 type transport system permease protein
MNWEQFRAIVWLRWRLSRNQFVRGGQINAILGVVVLAVLASSAAGLGIGGVALGVLLGAKATAPVLLLAWDGAMLIFLMFWTIGLLTEVQRSESVDLSKLLHLPLTLQQVFVFNYAASHLTPAIVLLLPGMIGLGIGQALSGGLRLALALPVLLSFLFLVTAWTYCLRGWLAALMVNKRRRRTVVVWMTIVFVLIFQLPNLLINSPYFREKTRGKPRQDENPSMSPSERRRGFELPDVVVQSHLAVPPGWVGYSAMWLKDGNAWPALGTAVASGLLGALGLMRAYRMTLRFYRGAEKSEAAEPAPAATSSAPPAGPRKRLLVERRLPGLPDNVAALTLATMRSLLRAPELKMALIMPIVVCAILGAMHMGKLKRVPAQSLVGFAVTGVVVFAAFSLAPTMANMFGLDRSGFRALVLLPIRRDHVLLAKNLAFLPLIAAVAVAMLALVGFLLRPTTSVWLTALVQLPTAFLLFSLMCNLAAILMPYRLAPGTLQAKKPKPIALLGVMATMLLTPVIVAPIVISPGLQLLFTHWEWLPWLPVNLIAATAILAGAAALYRVLLPLEGRLLQRREQTILREVTEEVE